MWCIFCCTVAIADCESSFSPARCADIAAACVSHLDDISATSNADGKMCWPVFAGMHITHLDTSTILVISIGSF